MITFAIILAIMNWHVEPHAEIADGLLFKDEFGGDKVASGWS